MEPGTVPALGLLAEAGILPLANARELVEAHGLLSRSLLRLRLAHNRQADEWPVEESRESGDAAVVRPRVRELFNEVIGN